MTKRVHDRCWKTTNPLYIAYHDKEWGVPVKDDKTLFEFLILEGFQAGLNWELILRKRENFRKAFDDFDPVKVSQYTDEDIDRLLNDTGIIRNRLKITSTIKNAKRFLEVQNEFGTFSNYIWQFVDGKPINNKLETFDGMPSKTEISAKMNKDLKKRGFKFVGPVICYSFMQAVGLVNDHLVHCFRYNEILNSHNA